ncbi:N-6 DNA methylase [Nocardia sp. 2]|uniref:N-6 DNA methylase n=1 Tax=Nocardia acididurans TaxID=2802282 RepID=A0ABS1MGV5_9NOCA|nr:N-6 DNA methylase [Nocardia acididurans]MBL1079903.1 N-6 DNA methylase [Nocardia acididurans]
MSKPASTVSAAEISRLAGVTRATVSNWRRRHADFPKAVDGSNEARPLFDLHEVQEWLSGHGFDAAESPSNELRTLVRLQATPGAVMRFMESLRWAGGGWVSDDAPAEFAAAAIRALERSTAADGPRIAVDALADRALEDSSATGVYITPERLARLMASLVVSPGSLELRSALDPACGSGSLLLAAAAHGATELYGQDVLPLQVQRTRLLLEAGTAAEPAVRDGDSLTADAFPALQVDAVLSNPPYGQRDWGSAEMAMDTRWKYGPPPRGESELAWVQHTVAHLRPGGTAVLLLPPAVATRPSGRKIRANLVRRGVLRAVIGLAPGAAQPWHVGLQLWVLREPQPAAPVPENLLFVDTTGIPGGDGEDRIDWDAVTAAVTRAWWAFDGENPDTAAESGEAATVRLIEVLDDEVDLTPAKYVRSSLDSGALSTQVDNAIGRLTSAAKELAEGTGALTGWAESAGQSWRFVTIAELQNHGQLQWIRSQPPASEKPALGDRRRVITAPDVATGSPASGVMSTSAPAQVEEVRIGDVLIPAVRSDRTGGRSARVAESEDVGAVIGPHIHALRADLDRLDPWFLAGFLTGAENVSATRTSTVRFDPSRLRVPVLSLAEQQRYGEIFRLLFQLRTAARRATYAAEDVAESVTTGLTAGALAPSEEFEEGSGR